MTKEELLHQVSEELAHNPTIGDIKRGLEIGYKRSGRYLCYIWTACLDCGKCRWVPLKDNKPSRLRCRSCAAGLRKTKRLLLAAKESARPPRPGEIRKDYNAGIGDRSASYIWCACVDCGKYRWVNLRNGKPAHPRCVRCHNKRKEAKCGEKSANWKGGIVHDRGYTLIKLQPSDFFYSMTDHSGYVRRHRLIMAESLGRCLQPWEIVHHNNKKLSAAGLRDDKLKNLRLVTKDQHERITAMENKIDRQMNEIGKLKEQIKLLQWHVCELEKQSEARQGTPY